MLLFRCVSKNLVRQDDASLKEETRLSSKFGTSPSLRYVFMKNRNHQKQSTLRAESVSIALTPKIFLEDRRKLC